MGQENEIVFEDLHGVNEDQPVTVDLDAGKKDDGISRAPAAQAADVDDADDDSMEFEPLHSAPKGAEDDEPEEQAASKASEDDDYSKKVKARIERERRAKQKALDEAGYWKKQAEKLAKDTSERERKSIQSSIEQAVSAIDQVQIDLERAIEDGQTKEQVRLTNKLTDLKADKARAEYSLTDLSDSGNLQPFDGKVSPESTKDSNEADKWINGRSDWYRAAGFERQTRVANRIDKEVYKDGFDPNTPEYFEELDKRIKAQFPDLYDDDAQNGADSQQPAQRRKPQPVVAPVGGENSRQSNRGSKVELGEADFQNMRRFGLDVNDPKVLKEYARNKQEAESGDRR